MAKELGIYEPCLRNWMHQADIDTAGGNDTPAADSSSKRISRCPILGGLINEYEAAV